MVHAIAAEQYLTTVCAGRRHDPRSGRRQRQRELVGAYHPKRTRWHKVLNRDYSQRRGRPNGFASAEGYFLRTQLSEEVPSASGRLADELTVGWACRSTPSGWSAAGLLAVGDGRHRPRWRRSTS
jgi:hypothetical protein